MKDWVITTLLVGTSLVSFGEKAAGDCEAKNIGQMMWKSNKEFPLTISGRA
jgi:hypothetical protein